MRQTIRADLTPAQKQELAIARRRAADEERRQRFLGDEKSRAMGLDQPALKQQELQRQDRANQEKARDRHYDEERMRQADLIGHLEGQKQRNRRQQNVETLNFQLTQKKDTRREWDLSDPKQLKNQKPPRLDDAEVLPSSSLQMFDGEDLGFGDRQTKQRAQVRDWANQKLSEEERQQEHQRQIEAEHAAYEKQVNAIAEELEQQKIANQRLHNRKTSQFNLEQAGAKKRNEAAQRALDQKRGLAEVEATMSSALMTEDRSTTQRYGVPHRRVPYHFKGMSAAERQAILDEQAQQREQLTAQRVKDKAEEASWASQEAHARREVVKLERQRERAKREQRIAVARDQKQQAQEHKASYSYIDKVVYTNPPDEGFHAQFGTTCR